MSKHRCEHCDELIDIVPMHSTKDGNKRQRLVFHFGRTGERCLGSEKQV